MSRAAGGHGAVRTIHDKSVGLFMTNPQREAVAQPSHLRSVFHGGAVLPGADAGSPRCSSPRCSSPRYLQHTLSSALRTRVADAPPCEGEMGVAQPNPAGGSSNSLFKDQIDLNIEQRRSLRRTLSAPSSRVPLKEEPTGGGGGEHAFNPGAVGLEGGRSGRSSPARPRPIARGASEFSSHDKSVPNARRSHRAGGINKPGPLIAAAEVIAYSAADGPEHEPADRIGLRRGRGLASPVALRPGSTGNPLSDSGLAMVQPQVSGAGVASGFERDNHLLGRRARGSCSPGPVRATAPYQWD